LLDVVSATSDIQISVRQLDGQLADQLILHELTVIFPDGKVTAGRVHLDWQPLSAMHQNLRVNVLEIEKLVLWSPSSDQSVEPRMAQEEGQLFSAGDLAFLPAWLTIEVVRLELKEFTSRDEAGVAVIADEVSGHYLWSRQQIKAPDFVYLSPYVHLRGALDWDLQHPHLQMSAEVQLPETLVSSESFHDIAVPVSFPGEIAFDGDWNNFSGSVSFGLEGGPKDVVWLAAEAQGSWRGIRFDALQGRYLAGRLTGDLELAWIDSFSMHGQLSAVRLNTGGLLDDLNGQASLEVTGGLLVPYDDQPLQSTIEARIHKAQVRGQEVAGSLFANWQKGSLNELNLDLSSSAASVVASGRPAERLELNVDVTDLNPFHPELSGGLKISGWLRWSDDYLTGDITGSGAELGWQDYSLARLSFQGRHLARETPLQFEIVGRTLQHAGIRLDRLQLGAKGSLEIHDLTMVMEGPAAGFETELTARYLDKSWQADILSFAGRTSKLGVWNLESPASLSWYEQALSLESFALSSHRGERLTLELRRWPAATDSRMSIGWHELHHEWLAYFLPEQDVSGKSSGELMLKIKDSQPVSMQAKLTASASTLARGRPEA
jgi:hypothetical protein